MVACNVSPLPCLPVCSVHGQKSGVNTTWSVVLKITGRERRPSEPVYCLCLFVSQSYIPRKIKSTLFTHKSSQPSFQIVKLTILYKSQVHPPNLKVKSILLIHLLSHMYLLSSQFHPPYSVVNSFQIVKFTMLYKSQVHSTNLKVKLNLFLDSQVHPPYSIVNPPTQ